MENEIFFKDWSPILRTIIAGLSGYIGLILFIRISGKRTLSQLNAFDFIVTVAFGSTLSTILLSKEITIAHGLTALLLLVLLQYLVAKLSIFSNKLQKLFKSDPTLLLFRGEYLDDALRKQRVTRDEVQSAIRNVGLARIEDVEAVILETNGGFSIIPVLYDEGNTALSNVNGYICDDESSVSK